MRYALIINGQVAEEREYADPPESAVGADGLPMLRRIFTSRDPYDPRIHTQKRHVRVEDNRVVERYESVPRDILKVRAETVRAIKAEARERLRDTDWIMLRQIETGRRASTAILQLRADIRSASDSFEAVVDQMSGDAIAAWSRVWPGD